MNLSLPDSVLGMQRCRQWTPLLTQQLRLRHLHQIMVYNVSSQCNGSFYYTLHLTTMCAPFYTSEKSNSFNPKWKELDPESFTSPSVSAFVIRIWQTQENDTDLVILTWCINLSGLVYLGIKLSEIQPDSFKKNSVILHLRGGYFTSYVTLRTDLHRPLQFIDNLNLVSNELETKVFRITTLESYRNEIKDSYTVNKLQKLHLLQLNIKNQSLDVQNLRDKITSKCGLCNCDEIKKVETPIPRQGSQLLTMTTLNKMLQRQEKPSIEQRQRVINLCKQIEVAKFKTKLLGQEKAKKSACMRQLKSNYTSILDENEERGCLLMENYRILSRDSEKLKEWHTKLIQLKEVQLHTHAQLQHRRQQLMNQLLFMYPINQVTPQKTIIGGIYLPDSDMLNDCSDDGLAVALGYVSHILLMCSSFISVPLRYSITYFGSRSFITDHINSFLLDRDRDFPLYAKGKDKMQFNYAVYLLNKNIAQLRWICNQQTPDLRATLLNLKHLLNHEHKDGLSSSTSSSSKSFKKFDLSVNTFYKSADFLTYFENPFLGSTSNVSDPILDTLKHEYQERSMSPTHRTKKKSETSLRPGLSEILAIPEAYMTQEISSNTFKTFTSTEKFKQLGLVEDKPESDSKTSSTKSNFSIISSSNHIVEGLENIEQGTDILHSALNLASDSATDIDSKTVIVEEHPRKDNYDKLLKQNRRISRSVGSITEEEDFELHSSLELGSDPLINVSMDTSKSFNRSRDLSTRLDDGQQEFLQKWLDSGPALICSEENLYPDEILGSTATISDSHSSPLTLRTDALLNTTSFNLIKPK